MAGRKQGRNATLMRDFCELHAAVLAMQTDVGDHQMDLVTLDLADRFLEIVERRDYLIAQAASMVSVSNAVSGSSSTMRIRLTTRLRLPNSIETPTE